MPDRLDRLAELNANYDAILCDVWGVLHNGVETRPFAGEALAAFRRQGGVVVLITNSPRRHQGVIEQLDHIGVDPEAFDRVVTSGDVTRALIEAASDRIYFIGPDRDFALLDGLGVEVTGLDEAGAVVCTGLYDDENETPDEYRSILADFKRRDLPFICANPDLIVERGSRLIPCAGSIAALYEEMGGRTLVSGKPHRPIYEAAMAAVDDIRVGVDKGRVLAIGDGMPTDVKGAQDFGLDLLYISDGIHTRDYTQNAVVDEQKLQDFLLQHDARPVRWMQRLR
ncbi:TIGR01459 family HAD-type hydrolase [Hoeflea prorocentri]|uniref:TIGR01459 family HAD-type hydrolase n=1 Tax=Hoeflea prorocentri TaxID=1922333 RepID=A0A9X3UNF5_9HYPH|nr:TIGR01459 family HAD-type hydrolase [Hoeflea prorocentri]MCY6382266.1 TIGR01459 family HAD-type hydrolase [Hoeflea prorocentri]MDA5400066.1 TIGR01459 family HAD-type hydrolase [Hoeflea prorocentri]